MVKPTAIELEILRLAYCEVCNRIEGEENKAEIAAATALMGQLEAFARSRGLASLDAALAAVHQTAPVRIPADIRAVIRDRAVCGGWLAPVTQAEWLAWLLDEARLQTEQAEAALEAEERQVRLKCLAALNAVITQLTHAGVLPVSLPWQKGTVKLAERWVDGLREGVARVNAEISVDSYGVSVTAEITGGPVAEVLVEFYDGAVTARVWDAEAYGGDPTTIELFKVESQGGATW